MSKWYRATYDGDAENGYVVADSDEEAVKWFEIEAANEGYVLLEIQECNDDECLSDARRIYPLTRYCVEVCCMKYALAHVEASTEEGAKEKARELYDYRKLDWYDEKIQQMNVEEDY